MFGVKKRKGRFEAPHVFVILFTLIIAASIMTYLIPAGHFERVELGAVSYTHLSMPRPCLVIS